MKQDGIAAVADIATEADQVDFAADVIKLKNANADVVFVYTIEEPSGRFLKEARRQNLQTLMIGETTLLSQKVIELAGPASNGVRGHVGLSADAPVPALQELGAKFNKRFGYLPDHNGMKGYLAVYLTKHVTEKIGKFDLEAVRGNLARVDARPQRCAGNPHEVALGQKWRHRSRQFSGRGHRWKTEDR